MPTRAQNTAKRDAAGNMAEPDVGRGVGAKHYVHGLPGDAIRSEGRENLAERGDHVRHVALGHGRKER